MQTFPVPPINIADLPAWVQNAAFLVPLVLLFLQIPFVKGLAPWKQAGMALILVTLLGEVALAFSTVIPVETLAKAQPYYAQFLVGFYAIAGVYGVVFGVQQVRKGIQTRQERAQALFVAQLAAMLRREPETSVEKFLAPRAG